MSLEQALAANTEAVKALVVAIASMGAVTAAATAPAPAPKADDKKAETKKAEAKKTETAAATGPDWKTVLEKIKEVNASKNDGCGRDGVTKIIETFGKAGDKVPALEAVGKHAEILALAQSLLDGAAAAGDDDLGI